MTTFHTPIEVSQLEGQSPFGRAQAAAVGLLADPTFADPLLRLAEDDEPGFFETLKLSTAQESISGTLADRAGNQLGQLIEGPATDNRIDANFNPYDLLTPDLIEEHPYLLPAFEDGEVLNVPNRAAFDRYINTRRQRWEDAQRLAEVPLGSKRITATLIGQVPDVLFGGQALRVLGVGVKATGYGDRARRSIEFIRSTSLGARSTRAGLVAGGNVGQELGLQWVDPNREIDLNDPALATAAVFGLAFGSSFEALGAARSAASGGIKVRNLKEKVRQVRESFAPDELQSLADVSTHDAAALRQMLTEPVTGPRSVSPVDTPETRPLVEQLQKMHDEAGHELAVGYHGGEEFLKWTDELARLEDTLNDQAPALRRALAGGKADAAVQDAARFGTALLRAGVTPGGRLRNTVSRAARFAHRTFFDEAEPTAEAAANPLTETPFISGEALRVEVRTRMVEARGQVLDAIDRHMQDRRGTVRYTTAGGELIEITNRRQVHRLGRAAMDYVRQTGEARRGRIDADQLDAATPQVVKEAAEPIRRYFGDMLDRLDEVELLRGRRSLERMEGELVDLEERIAVAEENLPARPDRPDTPDPAPAPAPGDAATLDTTIPREWRGEDLYLWRSGSLRTAGNREIRAEGQRPRKSFDTRWVQQLQRLDVGDAQVTRRLRQLTDEVWPVKEKRGQFWNTTHYLAPARLVEQARADAAAGRFDRADAAVGKMRRELAQRQEEAGQVRAFVDAADRYLPRRWLAHKIRNNELTFKQKLINQWTRNREVDFYSSESIQPDARVLDEPAVARLDRADRDLIDEFEVVNEQQLRDADPAAAERYDAALTAYLDEQAEATIRRMLDPQNGHGVQDSFTGALPLATRRLQELDETDFADFLDDNLEQTLLIYDAQLSGKIAARRAIQRNAEKLAPVVRDVLDEDLDLDPGQLIRAVNEDFRRWRRVAEQAGNADLQRAIEKNRVSTMKILERKLDELQGISPNPENLGLEVGWSHFIQRNMLKMPGMAFLGKVTLSALPDVSNLMLYTRMNRGHVRAIAAGLKDFAAGAVFAKVPKEGLEGLAAALDDDGLARTMALMEINDLPISPHFGDSIGGRALQKADAALEGLNRGFFRVNGMTRWNTVWKRTAARLVSWEILDGAKRMQKAARFMADGQGEAAALRKAGLSKPDAARLNRLGINGENAGGVVDAFHRHGTDVEGEPLAGLDDAAFDTYSRIVHPNLKRWESRELVETVTAAINAEVDNLIVTPKLLSRPLFNTDPRFAFVGKVFNQFQSFAFAYGNQLAPMVASRPGVAVTNWMAQAIFFGAVSDALHNHLSGRRSVAQTAALWTDPEKTAGMAYAAVNRAGLLGYLARPLAWADQAGVGVGPILGNDVSSMAAAQALTVTGKLGPFFDWADSLGRGLGPILTGTDQGYTPGLRHTLRKTLPFQNLLWTEALYTFTRDAGFDNPVGPGDGLDVFLTRPAKEAGQRQREARP